MRAGVGAHVCIPTIPSGVGDASIVAHHVTGMILVGYTDIVVHVVRTLQVYMCACEHVCVSICVHYYGTCTRCALAHTHITHTPNTGQHCSMEEIRRTGNSSR